MQYKISSGCHKIESSGIAISYFENEKILEDSEESDQLFIHTASSPPDLPETL